MTEQVTETAQPVLFTAPAGTTVATWTLTFTETGGSHLGTSVAAPTAITSPVVFPPVTLTPGTWTATAQAFDGTGAAVGPMVTDPQTYTVASPQTVQVVVPGSIAGTVTTS